MCRISTVLLLLISPAVSPAAEANRLTPASLACLGQTAPLGIDEPRPHLSWQLAGEARGLTQTAYQVLAASSAELLARDTGDLWDSGQVASAETYGIAYAGKPLPSATRVFCKVRVWDGAGKVSDWSSPSTWTMGLLKPQDWLARWIGADPAHAAPTPKTLGYHAGQTTRQDDLKWVQLDLGLAQPLSRVLLHPMSHAGQAGFGFPLRFKIETSDDETFAKPSLLADHTHADFPNPGAAPVTFEVKNTPARFVRVTATKLAPHPDKVHYTFALRQLEVFSAGTNIARNTPVAAKDSVEAHGWGKIGLTDGALSSMAGLSEGLLLRREFKVRKDLVRAVAFVCGLGNYQLTLNGKKVSDDVLEPGWTNYQKTVLYQTYDLAPLLQTGDNAVGLSLGHGMFDISRAPDGRYVKFRQSFGPLQAIAQLRFDYADGSSETVATDAHWQTGPSPITFENVFAGEDHDARRDIPGWDKPGFSNGLWKQAAVLPGPGGVLRGLSRAAPPLRFHNVLKPFRVTTPKAGVVVYDLGQNASLMPRLSTQGPAGSIIRIIPAELVDSQGFADRASVTQDGVRPAWWQYTLKGGGNESWTPSFFYHGARHLQVELFPAQPGGPLPTVDTLEGLVVHSSSRPVGEFSTSSELFNRIWALVRWAQRSNMMSVMTDCPHRERLGWLEETHLNGPSLRYNFDLGPLLTKTANDMVDSQLENGFVPNIAPEYFMAQPGIHQPFRNSPEWGGAIVMVPWQHYLFTGDTGLMARHYEAMKRYVAFLESTTKDDILSTGLGDWYDVGPKPPWGSQLTPPPLTATAFLAHYHGVLARMAALLGKPEEETRFDQRAEEIRKAFNSKFFDKNTGDYATGSQTANALPLVMNLAAPEDRPKLLEAIITDIRQRGNSLTSGDVGYRYLLRALADHGRSDVVFDMNHQSERPGYGMMLKRGATSLTEKWDAGVGQFGSQNHFMLGQINEWFFHDLAGIQPDPSAPGFRKVVIKPAVVGDLTWVKASYASVRGTIRSQWRREGTAFQLHVTIPPNLTATVHLPVASPEAVTEGGQPATSATGLKLLWSENGTAVFEVGSGTYQFASQLPNP